MMRVPKLAATFCVAAGVSAWAIPGGAADRTGGYMVFGPGNVSCGEWRNLREQHNDYGVSGWITGFVTAFNSLPNGTTDITGGTDVNGMLAWVDNYCVSNPLNNVAEAGDALVIELVQRSKRNRK